jgi:hypothetical protein
VKAIGDVRDIVVMAVVGLVGWLIYKAVKGAKGPAERVEKITTSDGSNIRLSGRIITPAQEGQVEYRFWQRAYMVSGTVTNRGDQPFAGDIAFESVETNRLTGLQSSAVSSPKAVKLAPGESFLVEVNMPVASSSFATTFSPVDATLSMLVVSGGERKPIALPVTYSIV